MKAIFSEKLLKSIPKEKCKVALNEIKEFYEEYIENNFNIRNMKHGWYVRQIEGTTNIMEIYKFRINIKDRILFTYGKHVGLREEFYKSIIFLEFCNHDKQIIRGRNINIDEYSEKVFEEYIDENYKDYKYDINRSISRVVTTDELVNMLDENDEKSTYYLNDEQFELISKDIKPLFLFGSAGSGKTTISINKAYTLLDSKLKIGYFTYSEYLVDEGKNIFEKILIDDNSYMSLKNYKNQISFNSINNYIMNKSKKTSIVTYEEFKLWIDNILTKNINTKKNKLSSRELFREIRGIIKGIIPIDWIPININIDIFTEEFIEYLTTNQFADINKNKVTIKNNTLADLNTDINNKLKLNKEEFKQQLSIIYDEIDSYILNNKMIDEELYLNLSKRYSIFDDKERIVIYDIAKKYQQWLESNNKFDENDITRMSIKKIINEKVHKFDYIICDEIQDLTELQMYFLFKLVSIKENILFCGDYNQTINPTFFDTGRVEAIFKIYNGLFNFQDKVISTNYRSSKNIVEFSNKLTNFKIKTIGINKKNDYFEKAIRENIGNIRLINLKEGDKEKVISKSELLSLLRKRAYVDIIVADDEEKNNFIKYSSENKLVFSVSDYKGLENEYIIGYNIISKFKDKWKEILDRNINSTRNENELRYYFNLFYVFITRARNNILLIEEDINKELLEYFRDEIEIVDYFDYKKLNLDRISTKDEHYKKAIRLEKNKQYNEAIESYKNADLNIMELQREINRCEALYKMLQGYYKEAADELLANFEYKHAMEGYLKAQDYLNVIKCATLDKRSYEDIKNILSFIDIDIIDLVLKNKNIIDWFYKFKEMYSEYMEDKLMLLRENVNSATDIIENIIRQ